jgi:hypothetical protein
VPISKRFQQPRRQPARLSVQHRRCQGTRRLHAVMAQARSNYRLGNGLVAAARSLSVVLSHPPMARRTRDAPLFLRRLRHDVARSCPLRVHDASSLCSCLRGLPVPLWSSLVPGLPGERSLSRRHHLVLPRSSSALPRSGTKRRSTACLPTVERSTRVWVSRWAH